jgi:type VI secretion system secreted protein VgrG
VFDGGGSAPAALPTLPEGALAQDTLYLDHRYHDDQPLAGAEYVVWLADGTQRTGKLDGQGRAVVSNVRPGVAQVSFGPMPGAFERSDKTPTPGYEAVPSDGKIDNLIDKYFKSDDNTGSTA